MAIRKREYRLRSHSQSQGYQTGHKKREESIPQFNTFDAHKIYMPALDTQ